MRPSFNRLTLFKIALLAGVWTSYGLLCAWQTHYWYAFTRTPMSWADCLHIQLTYSTLWALCTPFVAAAANRFRFERGRWPRNLLLHICVMTLTVSVTRIAFDLIVHPDELLSHSFTLGKLFRSIESTFDTGPLLYAVVVLVQSAVVYQERYQLSLIHI